MNLKKLLNKTEAQDKYYMGPGGEPLTHTDTVPKIPNLDDDEDGWDRACYPSDDYDECIEQQAELFVILADILIQQHGLGCGLGPLIKSYDTWLNEPGWDWLDCNSQSEECQGVCNEINDLLYCIGMYITIGCPEVPETEGCCCWFVWQNMSVKEQMDWLDKWLEKEGGITEQNWQDFYYGTYCIHTVESSCASDGGELDAIFYPETSEEECDSLACPPNCP